MQSSRSSCAKSDYSMSKNRTAHSRILLLLFHCAGTIPQSARLTAPFTQRGLWCGAQPNMRWKIEDAVGKPLRRFAPPPLTGEAWNAPHLCAAPHKFPLKGGCPQDRGFPAGASNPSEGHPFYSFFDRGLTLPQNTTPLPPPSPPRPLSAAPFSAQTPSGCPQKCCRPM